MHEVNSIIKASGVDGIATAASKLYDNTEDVTSVVDQRALTIQGCEVSRG